MTTKYVKDGKLDLDMIEQDRITDGLVFQHNKKQLADQLLFNFLHDLPILRQTSDPMDQQKPVINVEELEEQMYRV